MRALDNLSDRHGMRLVLSTTIVKESIGGLVDVVEFAKSRGLYGVNFQPIMPASTLPIFKKDGTHPDSSRSAGPYRRLLREKQDAHIDERFRPAAGS